MYMFWQIIQVLLIIFIMTILYRSGIVYRLKTVSCCIIIMFLVPLKHEKLLVVIPFFVFLVQLNILEYNEKVKHVLSLTSGYQTHLSYRIILHRIKYQAFIFLYI